jgi:guanine deaminase
MSYTSEYNLKQQKAFMQRALDLAVENIVSGAGGPFGCVIVKDGEIIGEGNNQVTSTNDPTAHAEVVAIRNACQKLNSFQLENCEIYTSCEPCPMCLGAIYWARPAAIFYGNTRQEAAEIGFDDQHIYDEIPMEHANRKIPIQQLRLPDSTAAFDKWELLDNKTDY